MRTLLAVINGGFALFTAFVIVTDGMSTQAGYFVFSLLLLIVPAFSAYALMQQKAALPSLLLNAILLGATSWVMATQYGAHPKETGLFEFALLAVSVPLLNCIAFAAGLRKPVSHAAA